MTEVARLRRKANRGFGDFAVGRASLRAGVGAGVETGRASTAAGDADDGAATASVLAPTEGAGVETSAGDLAAGTSLFLGGAGKVDGAGSW